jgi:hypothetical protein
MTHNIHKPAKAQAARANVAPNFVCTFARRRYGKTMKSAATAARDSLKSRASAIVAADNIFTFKKTLRPYVARMQDRANGFESVAWPIDRGMEYSVRLR